MVRMSSSRTSGTPAATSTRSGKSEAEDREAQGLGLLQQGLKLRGSENNDDGQRWEKNIVEHKGIGVMNHDEVNDDDTLEFDDQEVEQHHDDVGSGQDSADTKSDARKTVAAQRSGPRRAATPMTMPSTPGRADVPSGTLRRMSAMRARTTTASAAMVAGAATGTATARTMMTICGQQMRGGSGASSCSCGSASVGSSRSPRS